MATFLFRERRLKTARGALEKVLDDAPRFRYQSGRLQVRERYFNRATDEDVDDGHQAKIDNLLPWTPHLRVLLCGTMEEQSPLSMLRGYEETILKDIYGNLVESWKSSLIVTKPAYTVGRTLRGMNRIYDSSGITDLGSSVEDRPEIAFTRCGEVEFPPPEDRNVSMLPFIMGDPQSLPQDLQVYYDSAIAHCPVDPLEIGQVCYLTVSESFVKVGSTQRRGGLHIEAPGAFTTESSFVAASEHAWGNGHAYTPDELHGGIFIASSVSRSCKVWNCLVKDPTVVDSMGGIDHLRPFIGEGYAITANELVWMTDKTPHEALPQEEDGYRQFFRLVTSDISHWFADHSTPNPEVPLPTFVEVINGNKFEAKSV